MIRAIGAKLRGLITASYFAPGKAERFDAGNPAGRRLAAIPSISVSINALISMYGRTVIGRSRYLCANNPYALSAKETFVASLVGSGIKPSSLMDNKEWKKELQELWLDWTDEADKDGLTDFYGLQSLAAGELFEAGECFIRIIPSPDNATVPFSLQLLPSEMLPYAGDLISGGNTVQMGIEFDSAGKRVAYHFAKQNPGSHVYSGERERVPAAEVLHLFRPLRVGQIRGVPQMVASMARLAMLDLYDDAELERKRTAALFTGFVTKNPSEDEDDHPLGSLEGMGSAATFSTGDSNVGLEPGALVDLAPGEDVTFSEPADVGASYDPFQYRNLLQIAAGAGVPYASMTGDLMRANYGSIRAGEVQHRRKITAYQHHVMVFQFCRPIWSLFLRLSTAMGLTPWTPSDFVTDTRNLSRVKWIPPKWDWVDPLKDRQAEALAVANGFKSRDDVIEEEGYDPEEMDERIRASQERAKGLVFGVTAEAVVSGEAPADPDNPDGDPEVDGDGADAVAAMGSEDLRALVDQYGIAVRGGVVTPQIEDETFFRGLLKIPAMSKFVTDAWVKEKARRPVTLGASVLADPPPATGGPVPPGQDQPNPAEDGGEEDEQENAE